MASPDRIDAVTTTVAEARPDLSTEAPEGRIAVGRDVPHAEDLADDAEGAGGIGQPDPGPLARRRLAEGRRGWDERDLP